MKKIYKILIIVFSIIILVIAFFAYQIFQMTQASEDLTGSQSKVPEKINEIPPISVGEADWPNWRNINFDGKSNFKGIKTDWSGGLKKLWEVDFLCQGQSTASWSAPVIKGNRLIVPGRDEKKDLLFCLNAENGNLIWQGSYEAEAGTAHGPGSRATPFIDSNQVYTYGRSGDLVCWNLLDGKILWHKNVKVEGGEEPEWGLSSTPLVIDSKVIVQGGGKALVAAYDKMTGDLLWKSLEGPSGYSASVPLEIDSVKTVLVYHAKALSCLNPDDGHEIWRIPWETSYGVNATTPLVDGDIVFHSSGYEMGGQAIKVKRDSYQILWTNKALASIHSDPILIDGYLYSYSGQSERNKGEFKCIDFKTGKEMWKTNEIGYGTTTYADGYLICLDLKGNLFLVKPEISGFKKIAEIKSAIPEVKSLSWTIPVVANGKLYLRYLQRLICYDLKN